MRPGRPWPQIPPRPRSRQSSSRGSRPDSWGSLRPWHWTPDQGSLKFAVHHVAVWLQYWEICKYRSWFTLFRILSKNFHSMPHQRNAIQFLVSSGLFCEVFTVYQVCEKVWGRKFLTYWVNCNEVQIILSHDKLPRDQIQRSPSQPQEANLVPSLLILRPVT